MIKCFEITLPDNYKDVSADDIYDYLTNTQFIGHIGLKVREIPDPDKYAKIPTVKEFDSKLDRILHKVEDDGTDGPGMPGAGW